MQARHLLTRTTVAAALLSAFVLVQPAHAGLLGGGGSLGGSLGGSGALGGSLGPRSLDIGGAASGQASQQARVPGVERKANGAAEATVDKAAEQRQATSGRASATAGAAAQAGAERGDAMQGRAVSVTGAARGQAAAIVGTTRGTAESQSGRGVIADVSKNASISASPRSTQAGGDGAAEAGAESPVQPARGSRSISATGAADGSAQASRGERSVSAGGSVNASGSTSAQH